MEARGMQLDKGPLHIFSEELWQLIINQIDNSPDKFHTLVSLPELDAALHKQKSKWYFGSVLPLISKYLSTTNLRTTRQVCKMWHQDLHNLIDNHPYHVPYNADPQNGLPLNTVEVNKKCSLFKLATSSPVLKFCTVRTIDRFLETIVNSKLSQQQIFGRTLFLDPHLDIDNSQDDFSQRSIELLKKVGSEVNHLTLSSHRDFETTSKFYNRLRLILELTPNIKSLIIKFKNQDDTRSLSLLMARRPLPLLRFLQSIRLKYDRYVHIKDIFDCILSLAEREGSRVRKLIIPRLLHSPAIINYALIISNITELEICHEIDVVLLQKLKGSGIQKLVVRNIQPRLKKIDLSRLRVLHTRVYNIDENCCFRLPNLHTLRLMDRPCANYSFLFQLPSLTQLEIEKKNFAFKWLTESERRRLTESERRRLTESEGLGKNEITQEIVNWVDSSPVKNSPLWNWLPKLKKIKIGTLNEDTGKLERWATFCRQ